ncbi:alpha/beta hydrolase [Paucibacter sp. B2R-40]|uniref:alpha/beta hydrolase n=1 Tax=Paucibacter sp. B2R-40 TaxID=2893554 RepID=UPI0021E503A7|nr:alpha/beta hydrolase [Paucibacter sp. B2R-40]MCV2353879.1 alpha/beta hydrolase [Paucibacter sp. B2R-40]
MIKALRHATRLPVVSGRAELLPHQRLPLQSTLIASQNAPWMSAARRRGASFTNLSAAGQVNTESGFGPNPLAKRWVDADWARAARGRRPQHATFRNGGSLFEHARPELQRYF